MVTRGLPRTRKTGYKTGYRVSKNRVSTLLTDPQIRKAKAANKPYKLTDSGGLHLYVAASGSKLWRLRYEFGGKEKLLSLGRYPDLSLADARDQRREAKDILKQGKDPGVQKRSGDHAEPGQSGPTFEFVAREWHKTNEIRWTERHSHDILHSLERDIFPAIGSLSVNDITPQMVLKELRKIEKRGAVETAHRVRQRMSDVFVYAIGSGIGESDPAAIVKPTLAPIVKRSQPSVRSLSEAREVLRKIDTESARLTTKLAMRLLALTLLRPGALVKTPWQEMGDVDWDKEPTWRVPAARMKLPKEMKLDSDRDFLIPLSRQAVETIKVLRELTGQTAVLFPSARDRRKPMSDNALGFIMKRAGFFGQHVPHGWRSTFSTVMNELHPSEHRVIDMMLAHSPKGSVERAYNRAEHLGRRRELAQEWADMLFDTIPGPDTLTGLKGRWSPS